MFLRGDLEIQPADREVVSFDYLVDRLGDYLLNHAPTEEQEVREESVNQSNFFNSLTQKKLRPPLRVLNT